MTLEIIVSLIVFTLLLALNKKIQSWMLYGIVGLILLTSVFILVYFFKADYKPFIIPMVFMIIFPIGRLIFKKTDKREPILYIRGVQLNPQEEYDLSIHDYIYSFLIVAIPILSWILSYI